MRLHASQDRDFVEWHGGCTTALVWALDVDTPAMRAQVVAARERMGDLLLPRYRRQPHVTIAFAGLVPEPGATPSGRTYPAAALEADLALLRASGLMPMTARVHGWSTFEMAPYLGVSAPGAARLRELLWGDASGYVPHVTTGFYATDTSEAEVAERMAGWDAPTLTFDIDHLTLFSYETADIAGPLTVHGRLNLSDGSFATRDESSRHVVAVRAPAPQHEHWEA